MNKKVLSLIFSLAVIAASCKKDNTPADVAKPGDNLTVPASFTWQTMKDVNLKIEVTDARFPNKMHVVGVYLADPSFGTQASSKGTATISSPFNTRISIPTSISELYFVVTAPDGVSSTKKMTLASGNKSYTYRDVASTNAIGNVAGVTAVVEPTCGTETTNQNININQSTEIICFKSINDVTINVNANNGGTLKLNAPGKTITLGNFNHTNLKLFISSGTTVKFNNDLNISRGETFVNNGHLIGQKINLDGVLINNKEVNTSEFTVNANGELVNYCTLKVTGMFIANQMVNNYKLITAGTTKVNATGTINLYNGAMFQTNIFSSMDGVVRGIGSVSLFKTLTTTESPVYDNTNGKFTGALQYCGTKQLNDNQNKINHFFDGATQSCTAFIVKDDCNTIGNGSLAPEPDTDGDGVIDSCDDYPNDPTKAFNNYSCNYENGGSTIAFEDNWPAQGDYDMNDVVLTYKHMAVTNASNVIVRVEGEYKLLASGGTNHNGVGVMFNLPKGNAKGFVSSNNILPENGQDSLVVILFNDTRSAQEQWNTVPGEAKSNPVKTTFSFDVVNGPNLKTIGIGGYNPFIWNNSSASGRGHETHLRGKNPTKLANQALFNTKDDASTAGKYYSTSNNYPWALELPIADFKYPAELSNIKDAYLKYADWATSGGTKSLDWYKNTSSGYRDNSKIYK
jgi:LruC domain-containing protein